MKSKNKPKIFIGLTEAAGYFQNLYLGFKKLNYDVAYLNLNSYYYNYNDYKTSNYKLLNYLIRISTKKNNIQKKSFFLKLFSVYYFIVKILIFFWALVKFDTFIFATGSSFFNFWDFKILKFFKKYIICVSLGSDSRPTYLSGTYKDDSNNNKFNPYFVIENDKKINKRISFIEKYSNSIINYPQHGHFHKRQFISGNYIGFPTNLEVEELFQLANENSSVLKILHAPTRPNSKGSNYFRKIINELKEEGLNFEYIEITKLSNKEVINCINRCDIVLDECYSDSPLGGLGSEAASLAKPVLLSGYYSEYINNKKNIFPPSIYVYPSQIKNELRKLVLNKELRSKVGLDLFYFIKFNWNIEFVAEKYIKIIMNSAPLEWYVSSNDINYLYGWGLSKEELKNNLSELYKKFGKESFSLSHNSILLDKYLEFIKE